MPKGKKRSGPAPKKEYGVFTSHEDLDELERMHKELKLEESENVWTCTNEDAPALRSKLDDGRLTRVLARYQAQMTAKAKPEEGRPPWRNSRLLLGLCAIRLGCKLPDEFVKKAKANVYSVKTFNARVKEQYFAFCNAYEEGKFSENANVASASPASKVSVKQEQSEDGSTIQVRAKAENEEDAEDTKDFDKGEDDTQAEGDGEDEDQDQDEELDSTADIKEAKTRTKTSSGDEDGSKDVKPVKSKPERILKSLEPIHATPSKATATGCVHCGGIGHSDGLPLLVCGGCREVIYCGDLCQRKHWNAVHRQSCTFAAESWNTQSRATSDTPKVKPTQAKRKASDDEDASQPTTRNKRAKTKK